MERKHADLKRGDTYTTDEKYKSHSGKLNNTEFTSLSCGDCGNEEFKIIEIDTSCPGCGDGGDLYYVCIKCGAYNDD